MKSNSPLIEDVEYPKRNEKLIQHIVTLVSNRCTKGPGDGKHSSNSHCVAEPNLKE
jgi:hypothetical protein